MNKRLFKIFILSSCLLALLSGCIMGDLMSTFMCPEGSEYVQKRTGGGSKSNPYRDFYTCQSNGTEVLDFTNYVELSYVLIIALIIFIFFGLAKKLKTTQHQDVSQDVEQIIVNLSSQTPSSKASASILQASPLTSKLNDLKKALDNGLITEEDYQSKKQQLLDGFK